MKTHKRLWEKFEPKENFEKACVRSQKDKEKKHEIVNFNKNRDENLKAVRELAISGRFTTSHYRERKIYEPKERIIYILPYSPDRIVQHAIMNVLEPIFERHLIQNTYACIKKRGQLDASIKCSEYVRKFRYCLKCDIRKFYPSINQEKLSRSIHRIIRDDRFMEIVDDVIFSFPGGYNCPIGNYCSQWFGNFYLSALDNYVLHELKVGGFERYCDDFLLFDNDKHHLNECRKRIGDFLYERLELCFSKADLFDVKQGVDFCGYRSFEDFVLVRKGTAKRLIKRTKEVAEALDAGKDKQPLMGKMASTNGILRHACTFNLRNSINFEDIWRRCIC